jgi:hypothetical protein
MGAHIAMRLRDIVPNPNLEYKSVILCLMKMLEKTHQGMGHYYS